MSIASPDPRSDSPKTASGKIVKLARHHGFCHGVKKAVDKTIDAGELTKQANGRPVFVLGQLIHNPQMIAKLAEDGIATVESLDEVPDEAMVVIRTHGAPPQLVNAAEARGITVQDATCPDVRLVQNKAIELAKDGYTVVIAGKAHHPEVIGITAYAEEINGGPVVAINRIEDIPEALKDLPKRRIGVVSQTTQLEESFFDIVRELSTIAKELKVYNTICPATFYRQQSAEELAKEVDLMVVIGGKNSSNTTHLAEISREMGTEAIHIETVKELEGLPAVANAKTIGVTAGASTPEFLVDDVMDYLQSI